MDDKITTILNNWIAFLDKEKDKIELNVCVFTRKSELIADRPNLSAFYEEAYTNVIEIFKDRISFDIEKYDDDDLNINTREYIKEYIIETYIYCIIDLYLTSLHLDDYAYVYNYKEKKVQWVWLNAVGSTDRAESEDKNNGQEIYQKIKEKGEL